MQHSNLTHIHTHRAQQRELINAKEELVISSNFHTELRPPVPTLVIGNLKKGQKEVGLQGEKKRIFSMAYHAIDRPIPLFHAQIQTDELVFELRQQHQQLYQWQHQHQFRR